MSLSIGKVCGELAKLSPHIRYIYMPTGLGDFFRVRMAKPILANPNYSSSYTALAGAVRGKVYAGQTDGYADSATVSGWTGTDNNRGFALCSSSSTAHYRRYTAPSGMTHARLWLLNSNNDGRGLNLTWMDASNQAVGNTIFLAGTNVGGIIRSGWYAIPAGAAKLSISPATNQTVYLIGVQWINKSLTVDPDTAGSLMDDDPTTGDAQTILGGDGWGAAYTPSSQEICIYHNTRGGAFNADYACGGLSHYGITAATINWYTQTGTGALTAWTPAAGEKTVADYIKCDMPAATAYKEGVCTTAVGSAVGNWIFSASGIEMYHAVTYTTDMDVFGIFLLQCRAPADVSRVLFSGDSVVRNVPGNTVTSPIKTGQIRAWGASNRVLYDASLIDAGGVANYLSGVSALNYPRIFADATSTKLYINSIYDTATPVAFNSGSIISTRFRVNFSDISLAIPPRIRRRV